MRCPDLEELPAAPPRHAGWPWTTSSERLPDVMGDGRPWPRITVVTPSFNQCPYLEATVRSILLQGYPNIEYIVMDGGSKDGSVEIIKKYERWLSHWVSAPDGGQSTAINRGLRIGTGLFATWINSDDMLCRNALTTHAKALGFAPNVVYVGDCEYIDADGRPVALHRARVHTFEDLVRIRTIWRGRRQRGHIVQPEVLFPRELALAVGALDQSNHLTMDYDLWGRFLLAGTPFEYTHIPFAKFRLHAQQKTGQAWAVTKSLVETAARLVARAPHLLEGERQALVADLRTYRREYWLATGALARLGLPPEVVLRLRELRAGLRWRVGSLARRALFQKEVSR